MNGLSGATLFRAILWLALTLPATAHSAVREIDDELRAKLKATISQATSFSDRYEAEVWLVQKSTVLARFIDSPQERLRILKEVHKAAKQVGLPPEFVLAVIHIESAFDPYAVSRVGAQGMMQVMPFWKKEIGRESDNLIKLETNLQYGCTILKYYLDKENGHWADALARYNGSYGRYTYSHKVINVWTKYWR
ncbi:lytic transglycosylase domain-containing protein [Teredinibacter turnerae]|uniref:lytic transglycosylase domain-containing protein n=1 Tax=Teredinibacter turnerae TaxID=2426 RepID=UPI00037F2544|nr:lytic transglycosylase domain-containing protein [Teredinibacter turnerae]